LAVVYQQHIDDQVPGVSAQASEKRDERKGDPSEELLGRWTYRSYVPNPDITADFAGLEFGRGELLVEYLTPHAFIGRLVFSDTYQFRLRGIAVAGDPPTLRFRGEGDSTDSEGQVYDYFACVMPTWPHGVKQRAAIVGSVIRSVAHDKARAGAVAEFIALKR
jgi:hypothetical protein